MSEVKREDLTEVRRGFGQFNMSELGEDEYVTASGLHDGGYIVWKLKSEPPIQPIGGDTE